MSDLRLRTWKSCDKTIVSICGDLDIAAAPLLDRHLKTLIDQGTRHLVVNLSRAPYVDSAGLAALSRTHRALRSIGGHLSVAGCQPSVWRVMNIVGFQHLFPIQERMPSRIRRSLAA